MGYIKCMEDFDIYKIDGKSLRILLSIFESQSVSRTAERFDLNQSTVSHTLDKLRGAINDPLFVRTGRTIAPTEKTLAIIPRVREILAGLEGLVETETYDPARDTRPLAVAIPTPALLDPMRRLVRKARAAAQAQAVHIQRLAPRDRVSEVLENGVADLAIGVAGIAYPATLSHQPYMTDDLVVFYDPACREAPTTRQAYAQAQHGAADFGGRTKSVVETRLAEIGLKRRVVLVAPTSSMLGDLILGTDIIVTMPSKLADGAYRGLAWCKPPVDLPKLSYDLIWHRRHDHSGRNTWLRNLLVESAG